MSARADRAASPVRTVMVIGASGGLGTALTMQALKRGHDVWAYRRGAVAPGAAPDGTMPSRVIALDLAERSQVDSVELPDGDELIVLWVAGFFIKGPLQRTAPDIIESAVSVMFHHPLLLLRRLLAMPRRSFHLVTIASSSSWRAREHEALYCAVKAAQATATRQLLPDLREAAAHAAVTLVQPGGLAVPNFHGEYAHNIGQMLDVDEVAALIWRQIDDQREPFCEMQVLRSVDETGVSRPDVSYGPRQPEGPFSVPHPTGGSK